jgi:hypothetical protein
MKRYDSGPLELPPRETGEEFSRVDLVFYGVDNSGPSYEARVFINNTKADESTAKDPASGYAGSFTIFGHGGCYGDAGHCDIPAGAQDAFDLRPPHPLTPRSRVVILPPETVASLSGETITVTVVPVAPGDKGPEPTDALHLEHVRLVAYTA